MKFVTDRSKSWVVEAHRPLIPTIEYYNDPEGLLTLKFMWWKWWFKILIFYKK